jgi:anti-anti-sigma regulatory factor
MEIDTVLLSIDELNVPASLERAAKNLEAGAHELALDLSLVQRIDSGALRAFQDFARKAEAKKVKVVLRAVNVNVYKTLKLARLCPLFSFVN